MTTPSNHHNYARIVIVILIVILAVLGYYFYRQYQVIQRFHLIRAEQAQITDIREHRSLTAADVSYIQPWMTFDYIHAVFNVPSPYMQTGLGLADPQYPHISINKYAQAHGLDPAQLTTQAADLVRTYLSTVGTSTQPHQ